MLTEEQKLKLQELTDNCPFPNLKKILEAAIPKWISGEITPIQGSLGIGKFLDWDWQRYDEGEVYKCNFGKACLMGTALIGLIHNESPGNVFEKNFGSIDGVMLTQAFDGYKDIEIDIAKYIAQIRIVIFGK